MLASCSQEEMTPVNGGDGNYVLTVNLPKTAKTRAVSEFGQGYVSTVLVGALYDGDTGNYVADINSTFPANELQTTVGLQLAKGKTYNVVLFAQSTASQASEDGTTAAVYTFTPGATYDDATLSVNYEAMSSEGNLDDAYDCFYGVDVIAEVGSTASPASQTITLNRPIAQLNWGASDLGQSDVSNGTNSNPAADENAYGLNGKYVQSTLTVTVANTLNLSSGELSGETEVTVPVFAAPYELTFPMTNGSDYAYVAMNYLLAPGLGEGVAPSEENGGIYDVNITFSSNNPAYETNGTSEVNTVVEVSNVPLQANYQTNIYGALFSKDVTFNVEKMPTWLTPQYNVAYTPWDGKTVTTPEPNDEGTYVIAQPSDLAGFAAMLSENPEEYADASFALESDIDMGGYALPSIGSGNLDSDNSVSGTAFTGTFDGQGNTISNVVVKAAENSNITSIFPNVKEGGTVKDVNFANVSIQGVAATSTNTPGATGIVGVLNGGTVSGVTVSSGSVSGGNYTGAVVGSVLAGSTVENCENSASVTGMNNVGGVVGIAFDSTESADITLTGCINNGEVTAPWTVGGVVGLSNANVSDCTNNGTVTATNNSVGGVVAEQRDGGSITGCKNFANVKSASDAYGVGGVVGWVRYIENEAPISEIEVTGCYNEGEISGGTGVAGIVGIWYWGGNCSNNNNEATSITAGVQCAGGIVGQTNPTTANSEVTGTLTVSYNNSTTELDNITAPVNFGVIAGNIASGNVTVNGETVEYKVELSNNTPLTQDNVTSDDEDDNNGDDNGGDDTTEDNA